MRTERIHDVIWQAKLLDSCVRLKVSHRTIFCAASHETLDLGIRLYRQDGTLALALVVNRLPRKGDFTVVGQTR